MTTIARLLRSFAALTALAALTVGLPALLWLHGRTFLPDRIPTLDEITNTLTGRDSGEIALGALVLIGAAAWAVFVVSLLLEIVSLIGRRPVRGPRALDWSRGIAAALLSAALLGSAGTSTAAMTSTAVPLSAVLGDPGPGLTVAPDTQAWERVSYTTTPTSAQAPTSDGPTYQTRAGDSLWSIAETTLGDPERWEEIYDLNAGRAQADGATLADPAILRAGWTLELPIDATLPDDGDTHTVTAGDTLSDIAEQSGHDDWDALFDANEGDQQPDGRALTHPDLIYPGWVLQVPDAEAEADEPAANEEDSTAADDTATRAGEADGEPADGGQADEQADGDPTEETGVDDQLTDELADDPPVVDERDQNTGDERADLESDDSVDTTTTTSTLPLAISGLAAAGILTALAARRFLLRRRRRPGHRITAQQRRGPAETELREIYDPETVERLDLALRTLSAHLGADELALPVVLAATVGHRQIGLRLAIPQLPSPPFSAGPTDVDWLLDPGADLLDPGTAADIPAPYPALASLGRGPNGELILADLEAAGAITLTGHPDDITAVLLALAIELGVSGWADHLDVTLVGIGVRLAELLPDRLRSVPDLDTALDDFARRADQIHAALDGVADTAPDARGRGVAADAWIPSIILTADPITDDQQQRIRTLIERSPRSSLAAVVAAGDTTHRLPGPWQIPVPPDPAQPATIDVLGGTPVTLQRCDPATYRAVLDDLTAAADPAQHRADGYDAVPDEPPPPHHPPGYTSPQTAAPRSYSADELDELDEHLLDDLDLEIEAELGLLEELTPDDPHGTAEKDQDVDQDHVGEPPTAASPPAGQASAATAAAGEPPAEEAATEPDNQHAVPEPDAAPAPDRPRAPMLRLLGPLRIDGVDPAAVADSKRNRIIELAAYMALHPGRDGDEISHALGGRQPWAAPTRQSQMSRLRGWLGTDPTGQPYVAPVTDTTGYRLSPTMDCDWTTFQHLARRGLTTDGPHLRHLEDALALVDGEPFAGAPAGRYDWADLISHEMIAAITDVAHTLALTHLDNADLDAARAALRRGLLADPVSELLRRDLCRVEYQAGDMAAIATIAAEIHRICDDLDVDPDPETTALLRHLQDPRARAAPPAEVWLPGPRTHSHP